MLTHATAVLAETNPDTGQPFFPGWVWAVTIVGVLTLIAIDLFVVDSKPHEVGTKEAARWVSFYVALAVLFGLGMWVLVDGAHSLEFFSGYILEYSLSVDNLFVFVLIMSSFTVPKIHQHRVLLIGILIALILRTIFIVLGAAVISRFQAVFFLFGAFLLFTAWKLATESDDDEEEYEESKLIRLVRKIYPVTDDYHGTKTTVKIDGKRWLTPMFIVMLAIGSTDLLFALDSIPAIFGVTKEPYIVFTANAFALMGLRQLYFLIGGLLDKLVYLSKGLSIILGFIGLKLIYEASAAVGWLPHIDTKLLTIISLGFIVLVLIVTTVLSLRKSRADQQTSIVDEARYMARHDPPGDA
ncbi:TerC/Alx family metal homeostasis membrane protein [Blastococcus sp. Marseille-P5729]|uniref:TerC/Alx family metal homeostasis membrane protein n=1 Tax=Blastococcus sp. Marseille-P5729 TaxID=2086582 RepID=UPI000D0E69F1|nr:TerC/Alx family metal homeostasis membrane protein [Blastococcus sp. Marseille-P5729]